MFHYTYVIRNEETGQYYIGVRSSELEPNEDTYMGSGKRLKAEMLKSPEVWFKYVLEIHPTRNDANTDERQSTKGHLNNGLCLNERHGGNGWFEVGKKFSENHKANLKIAAQRRVVEKPTSVETIAKIVAKTTGQKRSVEIKLKMSATVKGKYQRPMTEEEKLHLSKVTTGLKKSPEHIANVVAAKKRNKELRLAQQLTN